MSGSQKFPLVTRLRENSAAVQVMQWTLSFVIGCPGNAVDLILRYRLSRQCSGPYPSLSDVQVMRWNDLAPYSSFDPSCPTRLWGDSAAIQVRQWSDLSRPYSTPSLSSLRRLNTLAPRLRESSAAIQAPSHRPSRESRPRSRST